MTNAHATRELLVELRQRQTEALAVGERQLPIDTIDLGWLLDLAESAASGQESSAKGAALLDKIAGTSGRFDYLDELEQTESTQIHMQQHPEYWQQILASVLKGQDEDSDCLESHVL